MTTISNGPRHISLPELDEELQRQAATVSSIWNDSRRHARTKVNARGVLMLEPTYASAGREVHSQEVFLRDISRGGIRFIHGAPLFPGEYGKLILRTGTVYRLQIVWCRRIATGIFASGGQFVAQKESE